MARCVSPLVLAAVLGSVAACGTSTEMPESRYPPHPGPVFFTKDVPPPGAPLEYLGEIKLKRGTYGSMDPLLDELADHARKLGADGVVRLRTGREAAAFAWAVPYANGLAVRSRGLDYRRAGMVGEWR